MANFENGVASYIKAVALVEVGFPVDFRGNADISCKQCRFYVPSRRKCGLNDEICEYPERHVGSHCPLERVEVPQEEVNE